MYEHLPNIGHHGLVENLGSVAASSPSKGRLSEVRMR